MFQNDTLKHFRFSKELMVNIKLTTQGEQEQNRKLNKHERFYDLSIPIFSLDQRKAYVQINRFCPFCGSGVDVFLAKQNGKWKIIKQHRSWIN
ncbi:MAG: hypothetical protein JWQ79_620 [Mucilaginibacter sp.]|nr:hypothetical protein [Mucilaginibacter sp.]